MGRYYHGQLSGKFWFGIQNSGDATHFGVNANNVLNYYVCNCEIYEKDYNKIINYCEDCFSSYEEHIQAMIDDDIETSPNNNNNNTDTWHLSETEIVYQFEGIHIKQITSKIQELEKLVGQYLLTYNIKDENDEITYDCTTAKDIPGDVLKLIPRLCLGKQILYCLQTRESCNFWAEL